MCSYQADDVLIEDSRWTFKMENFSSNANIMNSISSNLELPSGLAKDSFYLFSFSEVWRLNGC